MQELLDQLAEGYRCPISHEIMFNPVVAKDGVTYEEDEIKKHFENCKKQGKSPFSPMHKTEIATELTTNFTMRSSIQTFVNKYPQYKQELYFSEEMKRECEQAIKSQDNPKLKQLLEKEPRLLETSFTDKKSILPLACEHGNLDTINIVVEKLKQRNLLKDNQNQVLQLLRLCYANISIGVSGIKRLVEDIFQWQKATVINFFKFMLDQGENTLVLVFIENKIIAANTPLDHQKNTALHIAVLKDQRELAKRLVGLGAKVKQPNTQNQTPITLAEINENQDLADNLLLWHRAVKFKPFLIEQDLKMKSLTEQIVTLKERLYLSEEKNRSEVTALGESITNLFSVPVIAQSFQRENRRKQEEEKQLTAVEQELQDIFVDTILKGDFKKMQELREKGALIVDGYQNPHKNGADLS